MWHHNNTEFMFWTGSCFLDPVVCRWNRLWASAVVVAYIMAHSTLSESLNLLNRNRAGRWTLSLFSCRLSSVWSFHTHWVHWQGSLFFWGMSSLTGSDICFPQELDYSTSCVHTGSLCSANLYTGRNRWRGGWCGCCEACCSCCAVSAACGGGSGEGKQGKCRLKLKLNFPATLSLSLFLSIVFNVNMIFSHHWSSLLFSAGQWISSAHVLLGAWQVVLIYGDFISREECFRMSAWCSLPPSRAHWQTVFCSNEKLPTHVFNKDLSEAERESKRKWKQGRQKRDEDR